MALTVSQRATLKADILASVDASVITMRTAQNWDGLAAYYSAAASPAFYGYRTNIPVAEVINGVVWANLTPADTVPTLDVLSTSVWQSRSLACQGKQFNLQMMLQSGAASLNASFVNFRSGLQDALTNIPSGALGANLSAGWVAIRDGVLARAANRVEKLFATTGGAQDGSTAAKAASYTHEGAISSQVVSDAMGGL